MTKCHNWGKVKSLVIIEGPYLGDILDQPRALRDTLAALKASSSLSAIVDAIRNEDYDQIVLTGMGGSYLVLYPLFLTLTKLGLPVRMAETSELIHFMPQLLNPRNLLMVVSQSGRSGEIVRLLKEKFKGTKLLAITNDAESPLAIEADISALILAGPEASGACKTTTATLLALGLLSHALTAEDPAAAQLRFEPVASAVESYLSSFREHVDQLSESLRGFSHLFITGRGPSLPAAGIGGMLMKETAHFHAEGMGSAAFRHGPFEMLRDDCFVLVFEGDAGVAPLNISLVADVRSTGARAELIGPFAELPPLRIPDVHSEVRPILEMLPLQMVSLALAALDGREAGKFERIGKITIEE
jgi:glutamine---fructose-6-phosphate transaminase (isomerizing)